jgi:hypothetical protein
LRIGYGFTFLLALSTLACSSDALAPDRPDIGRVALPRVLRIQNVGGRGQHAYPGHTLPAPLVVELRDGNGHPAANVPVEWSAMVGTILPTARVTDSLGRASAAWTMGSTPGKYAATASVTRGVSVEFEAWIDKPPPSSLFALMTETYEGSGQAVHPDHVTLPTRWAIDSSVLVATPYPGGNANFENPSLFTSTDMLHWAAPEAVVNPLVRPSEGYLSDPDALYNPESSELWLYYRQVTKQNLIWLIRSSDGIQWSEPELVASARNHQLVSPTVVRRAEGDWMMWAVNAGVDGCSAASTTVELRRSADGIHWSAPESVALGQAGGFAWHLDVRWIAERNEFWALYPMKTAGNCTTSAVYLATSPDGVQWQSYPAPLLEAGVLPELWDVVYRSSLDHDAGSDTVDVWYSGARYDGKAYAWAMARERLSIPAIFARVTATDGAALLASSAAAMRAGSERPPALTNATAP